MARAPQKFFIFRWGGGGDRGGEGGSRAGTRRAEKSFTESRKLPLPLPEKWTRFIPTIPVPAAAERNTRNVAVRTCNSKEVFLSEGEGEPGCLNPYAVNL